jgi:hypothetical protein
MDGPAADASRCVRACVRANGSGEHSLEAMVYSLDVLLLRTRLFAPACTERVNMVGHVLTVMTCCALRVVVSVARVLVMPGEVLSALIGGALVSIYRLADTGFQRQARRKGKGLRRLRGIRMCLQLPVADTPTPMCTANKQHRRSEHLLQNDSWHNSLPIWWR